MISCLVAKLCLTVTPWIAACQAFLSFTISLSLLKLMSIESLMPSNFLILYCPLLFLPSIFPSIRVLSNELSLLISIGTSASASGLPMNIQGCFPLELPDLISLLSKQHSGVFSITIIWKYKFLDAQPSFWSNSHISTWLLGKSIALTRWTFVSKVMSLPFNSLSRFVITFFPRRKHLLVSSSVFLFVCFFFSSAEIVALFNSIETFCFSIGLFYIDQFC